MVPIKDGKNADLYLDGFPAFSESAVFVLQQFIEEIDIIILTTSHKSNFTLEEWMHMFHKRNINVKKIDRLPDNVTHKNRKDELVNLFENNDIQDNFIIIDDDKSLNELPQRLKKNLMQTQSFKGLCETHLPVLLDIISKF